MRKGDEVTRLGTFLMIMCVLSATLLGVLHGVTEPIIRQREARAQETAMQEALPTADYFEEITSEVGDLLQDPLFADVRTVNRGYAADAPLGYVIGVTAEGYVDEIYQLVGIADEQITGIRVVRQRETPGLGARVADERFLDQFAGLGVHQPVGITTDGGQVTTITGATVSCRSVAEGVDRARELYRRISEKG